MSDPHVTLDEKEFKTIKTLIREFSSSIEAVLESDFSFLDGEERELCHTLLEMQDMWESEEIKHALDAWLDIDQ